MEEQGIVIAIVTALTKSGDELEKELLETIEQLKGTIIEGEVIEDEDDK